MLALGALVFTARTYLLGREGQVTDRYTKAVDQLGAGAVAQRTGGVYALERIMSDSPKDHWAVVQVLAALTVLGRRPRRQDKELDRIRLSDSDLRWTLLRDGRLDKAALRGAKMREADLVGAILRGAELQKTDLTDARLTDADLTDADLTGATLVGTELAGAAMRGAHLAGASAAADLSPAQSAEVHCLPKVERCPNRAQFRHTADPRTPTAHRHDG